MKRVSVLIFFLAMSQLLFAQNEKLASAFAKSYQYETGADYKTAIQVLKDVYGTGGYELDLRLGWLHYKTGRYNEAMDYYSKAITAMPYSVEAKQGYANAASAAGNWDKVLEQYLKILAIDPQNSSINYYTGMIYYNKKDYKSAYRYFEKVVNLYPFDYHATLMFAWSNFQLGKLREAKVLFGKVLLMSPNDKSALEGLSLIK